MQTLVEFWKGLTGGQAVLFAALAIVVAIIALSALWGLLRAIDRALSNNMSENGWRRFFIACAIVGVITLVFWIFN